MKTINYIMYAKQYGIKCHPYRRHCQIIVKKNQNLKLVVPMAVSSGNTGQGWCEALSQLHW